MSVKGISNADFTGNKSAQAGSRARQIAPRAEFGDLAQIAADKAVAGKPSNQLQPTSNSAKKATMGDQLQATSVVSSASNLAFRKTTSKPEFTSAKAAQARKTGDLPALNSAKKVATGDKLGDLLQAASAASIAPWAKFVSPKTGASNSGNLLATLNAAQVANIVKIATQASKFSPNSAPVCQILQNALANTHSPKSAPISPEQAKKLEQLAQRDAQMFRAFDFMQIMNQLIYGNHSQSKKRELMQKAQKIASEG